MTRRGRILSFGSAGLLVVAGSVLAALLASAAGQVAGMVLIGLGLVLATGLVFLEVGLSEDRERARERERARQKPPRSMRRRIRPARLTIKRSRGHRRRLR